MVLPFIDGFNYLLNTAVKQLAGYWSLSSLNMAYIYDELTIKERQKKDSEFSSILNSVRCGFPTDETILILKVTDDNL